jgi:hypothetical protein
MDDTSKRKNSIEDRLTKELVPLSFLVFFIKFSHLKPPYLMPVYLNVCAAPGRTPLSWRTRMQIAIDVANALVIYRIMLISLAGCLAFVSFQIYVQLN